jgi:lysophospholipase L1-like esterase
MRRKKLLLMLIVLEIVVIIFLFGFSLNKIRATALLVMVHNLEYNTTPNYPPLFFIQSNNSKLIVELRPNFTQLFDGYVVRLPRITKITINSDGFRGKDYSLEKPNSTIRIIVLGDSVAFGWGVNDDEVFSEVLERMLNNNSKKIRYEVLNLAVPGYNTEQNIEMLKTKGLKYKPDIVIIAYHRNDIYNNTRFKELYEDAKKSLDSTNISEFEKEVRAGIIAGQILDSELIRNYDRENWNRIYTPWQQLYSLKKENGFKVIIVTGIEMFQDDFHLKVMQKIIDFFKEKVLIEKDWYLINFQPTVMRYPREKLVVHPLDGHASPFAHELIAKEIYDFIKNNNLIPTD